MLPRYCTSETLKVAEMTSKSAHAALASITPPLDDDEDDDDDTPASTFPLPSPCFSFLIFGNATREEEVEEEGGGGREESRSVRSEGSTRPSSFLISSFIVDMNRL